MKRTKIDFDMTTLPPVIVQHLEQDAIVHDSSSSSEARTLLFQGTSSMFLKIMSPGKLEREYQINVCLNAYQLSPEVIAYTTTAQHDYLLTAAVQGNDGVAGTFLQQPEQLAMAMGHHLRKLHAIPIDNCPYPHRSQEILKEASLSVQTELQQTPLYQPIDHVWIHGDYCLPNVIMHDDMTLSGFIDIGDGGIGDLHYDLAWGLWSLHYNLDTDAYDDYFLNAYGRELVNLNGIAYFRKIIDSLEF
ncbi:phosphotransferase [Paenibacillus kandeliae]|uniref:phosphotransferase n=1 Tax=Paenibacillus kandeliae TaxID=3231269 RepID=UPI003459F2DD